MVYIDFMPKLVQYYGGAHSKYESFRRLMQRANDWLERNPQVVVINCETVAIKPNEYYLEDFDNKITIWDEFFMETIAGKTRTARHPVLHVLRIWYLGKTFAEEGDDDDDDDDDESTISEEEAEQRRKASMKKRKSIFERNESMATFKQDADRRKSISSTASKDSKGKKKGDKGKTKSVAFSDTKDVKHFEKDDDDDVSEIEEDELRPQQIGYVNIIPCRYRSSKDLRSKRRFEHLGATIGRFNNNMEERHLPGEIISTEIYTVPMSANGCEYPDATFWRFGELEFHMARVYYLLGESLGEKIGFADFIPMNDGVEDFTHMVSRANEWIQKQSKIHVTNFRTDWCNFGAEPTFVESQSAIRRVWINAKLVRVLRVWYTTPLRPELVEVPPNPVVKWTLFEAEILVQKTVERVETFTEVIRRALIDLEKLEAQILNVETVVLFSEYSKRKLRREEMDVNVGLQIKHMLRFYIFGNIFTNQLRIKIPKRTRDQAKATGAWKDLGARLQGGGQAPAVGRPGGGGAAKSKACVIS
ncbi:uncharacterized protein LOC135492223 [Lineus longissimus]|uniref:uncharacterized protein LOC135492223 n=1 Tax=Lineus longissimus TaxID=88925 RepID=UPI002B4D0A62